MNKVDEKIKRENHVCPVENLRHMDSFLRKIVHNPKRLLKRFVKEGMKVMDLGCGGGFATLALSDMVGKNGTVIAADLQEEMLEITKEKVEKAGYHDRVIFHKCSREGIHYNGKVDFVLAFFMLHETNNIQNFLKDIYNSLDEGGFLYVSEPSFHVTQKQFASTLRDGKSTGFEIHSYPKVLFGRSVVFKK